MISRLFRKKVRESGLSPGTLILEGQQKVEKTSISLISYDEGEFTERGIENIKDCFPLKAKPVVNWINVRGIHNVEQISSLGNKLQLHPLVLEDILNTDHRPKFEDFDDYIYIILKMLSYDDARELVISEQVSLALGPNFVLTFLEHEDPFDAVRKRIGMPGSRHRKMNTDYLVYSMIDIIVDNYYSILEKLGDRIETIEEDLLANPDMNTLQAIHNVKNELVLLRKTIWPVREIINALDRLDTMLIHKSTHVYLRDIYDHLVQIIDNIESLRDIVSGMVDIYLSNLSNRTNAVMKVLTIIATIFIPLTFIVGIYGMNFKYMPELDLTWSYPVVLLIMAVIAVIMIIYFKRKKWL